jgi:hypothetical protein
VRWLLKTGPDNRPLIVIRPVLRIHNPSSQRNGNLSSGIYNPTSSQNFEKNQVPYPKVNFVTKINNPQNSEMKIL